MDEAKKKKIIHEIKSIIIIIVVVFALRSTFYEPFRIPSGSMIPTLMIGDFILVEKFTYGFKVPYSDMFWDPIYITKPTKPKRGDVIVFKYPKDTSLFYIKRVVGLPGDTIEIIDKIVYINDAPIGTVPLDENKKQKIIEDMDEKFKGIEFSFYESQTGENKHVIQVSDSYGDPRTYYMNKKVIPKGKYFVMGDNRDYSSDSRFWGYVPFEYVKGKALFVWFSWILPFSDHPMKFRPWRVGTIIN